MTSSRSDGQSLPSGAFGSVDKATTVIGGVFAFAKAAGLRPDGIELAEQAVERLLSEIEWGYKQAEFATEVATAADRYFAALEELLDVAERMIGGDNKLDPERWYAARDFARIVVKEGLVRRESD